jgi:hypothetical protein
MFKMIWDNLVISFFCSIFGGLAVLIVSGEHMGINYFWFNTILFTIIFTVVDLFKKRNVKEAE